jgi:competence protein ComEA
VRLSSRPVDDADVIRARLRALLDEARRPGGWLPDDLSGDGCSPDHDRLGPWQDEDSVATVPVPEPDPEQEGGMPAGLGRHRAPDRAVRWDPGRRGGRSLWIAGLVAALLVAGWTWLDRPRVEPAPPEPAGAGATSARATPPAGAAAETSATVVVSVVGLVARPGLVTLPSGARIAAAIDAAGGLLPEADPASVNLAAVVTDGQQVAIGVPGPAGSSGRGGPGGAVAETTGAGTGGPVDLNTAAVTELDALPGIGPVLAQRIVDYRTRNGAFTSVDQLDDVPGIGPAIFAELAELVAV